MRARKNAAALTFLAAVFVAVPPAFGVTFNTSDLDVYNLFATGATVQTFENIAGMTPLGLTSYANALDSSTAVPAAAQLGLDIPGFLFHSGGGSFNNPTGNPGTPTALLALSGTLADDPQSPTNVVGSLEINTEQLDLDHFLEIVSIDALQSRVGVWLNPSLGDVTFSAFDSTGTQLETTPGTAGNFVGIQRATADIKFVSVVGGAAGFTIDDLTFAGTPTTTTPEPATFLLLALGSAALWRMRRAR